MTDQQEVMARMLRLDGKSSAEVAERLGVPESEVMSVYCKRKYNRSIVGSETTKYVNLDRWMRTHGMSRVMFADKCGIHPSTLNMILLDATDFGKSSIDKILRATGLTYEVAFAEGGERNDR